ncbi:MAG: transcription termination/antitermination NusG family protein, partial [Candidatus Udaeobacter sp.]
MTWSLATTHPNIETRVAAKLVAAGVHLQLFFVKTLIVVRGVIVHRFRPAFPRYLFVRAEHNWREILDLSRDVYGRGLSGFLTNTEGRPLSVHDSAVDALLQRSVVVNDKHVLDVPPKVGKFKFGDNVQIIGNSLISGRKGLFQHLSGDDVYAMVLIDVMGRHVPFRVPEAELVSTPLRVPQPRKRKRNWKERRAKSK